MYVWFWLGWEDQSVPDNIEFIKTFKERVMDCELQYWANEMRTVQKLRSYCLFKEERIEEVYLTLDIPRRFKVCLARFRTGSHNFQIEIGRHNNIPHEDRICEFCWLNSGSRFIEDEFHVLFQCSVYDEIRGWYLKKHYSSANEYAFKSIMKSDDKLCIIDVANFIVNVFKMRKDMM